MEAEVSITKWQKVKNKLKKAFEASTDWMLAIMIAIAEIMS